MKGLPTCRNVSIFVMRLPPDNEDPTRTVMGMTFGQFLDHDMTGTPGFLGECNDTMYTYFNDIRTLPFRCQSTASALRVVLYYSMGRMSEYCKYLISLKLNALNEIMKINVILIEICFF